MMSAFEKHGLRHLSASSLNLWRAQPGLWCLQYLLKVRDEMGAAVLRGVALEGAAEVWLRQRDRDGAIARAKETFEINAQGEITDEIEKERANLPGYAEQVCDALKDAPNILMTQAKIEHRFDGLEVPLVGYVDFIMEDESLFDLKTTAAIPSTAARPDHARQVALYRAAREAPGSVLYVSGKKFAVHPVDDGEMRARLDELRRDALSLAAFLARSDDATELATSVPIDTDNFRCGEAKRTKALELFA